MKYLSLLCLTATPLLAEDAMQMRNLENRVSALEQTRKGNGSINPAARPTIKKGAHLWGQVEALYFHPTEDNLAYTFKNTSFGLGADNETGPLGGPVKNVSYDWDWGVRAGIGYDLPHDGWDLFLNWTWFHTQARGQTTTNGIDAVNLQVWTSTTLSSASSATAQVAVGKARLHWALLDFEMGREFLVSKWMLLRPFVGARGAWIHRDLKIHYFDNSILPNNSSALGTNEVRNHLHNQYNGGGLRTGLNSAWKVGCGFSFYGDLALSLLYGKQQLRQHDSQLVDRSNGGHLKFGKTRDHWTTLRPMLDLALGLRWDKFFYDAKYRVRFQLGWEEHLFFGFDNDLNFISGSRLGATYTMGQGNLGLSGVSFQARFDF